MDFGFLNQPYQSEHWTALLRFLFGDAFDEKLVSIEVPAEHERVDSFEQFGTIQLKDMARTRINAYAVVLKPKLTKVHRNRVMLATIVDKIRADASVAGALAVFADPESGKWRLTLVAKRERYDDAGEVVTLQTEPKRFTYLLGKDENTRTARQRFESLARIGGKRLEDILEAFSVEKVNKEFFERYRTLYNICWNHLARPGSEAYQVFKIDEKNADDKDKKPMRDFAKRLLGRLVFIYFLQKKGWMGCPINSTNWVDGNPDFVAKMFRGLSNEDKAIFHSKQLTRLFFDTLNNPNRPDDEFELPDGNKVRVPFLNGGLFEDDVRGSEHLDLPADWFAELFAFFEQYNFTVDESAPNDHEIGIDPEMLGHIFENLLEENREKGAYYTPKDIVHYMCQESLLHYLKERVGLSVSENETADRELPKVNWSDSRAKDEEELTNFVRHKQRGPKDGFVYANARLLEKLLKEVRICDPAIGSGAFPMGLLYEIFHCQVELDLTEDYAALKKEIIHRCIYGVDKDNGAVDIARLRFWLALVVDEDNPEPLPNLDYKIMQGDSLLESFEGIDLSNLMGGNGSEDAPAAGKGGLANNAPELWTIVEEPAVAFGDEDKALLENWIKQYFDTKNSVEKSDLQSKISSQIEDALARAIRYYKVMRLSEIKEQERSLARELELKRPGTKTLKELKRLEAEVADCEAKQERLAWWQERDEKPFFLWHTWFKEVFDAGGFDIVIGNPPYVRQETIGTKMKAILKELYPLTFKGTADLLVYFVELAYNKLLRPGGQFAFIINNKWIRSSYGEGLRNMLQHQTRVHQLLDFGDLPVFESAMAYPCILMFEKKPPAPSFDVVLFEEVPFRKGKKLLDEVAKNKFPVKTATLDPAQWQILPPLEDKMLQRINEQAVCLDAYIEKGAYYGIKTGASTIFMLSQEDYDQIPPKERDIIKPMLMGRDLKKYDTPSSERWLLFTRRGIDMEQYPSVFNYLSRFREQLEPKPKNWKGSRWPGRKEGTYKWYEIQDAVDYWELFEQPKIMYQGFQVSPCFTLDKDGLYCNNSMWFIPRDDKYLLGYLNSQLGWWCITLHCSRIQNGYQLMYDYFKNVPVPQAKGRIRGLVTDFVDMVMLVKQQEKSSRHQIMSDFFEWVIDALMYEAVFEGALREKGTLVSDKIDYAAAPEGIEEVESLFKQLYAPTHPLQASLYNLRLVKEVAYIQQAIRKNSLAS